MIDGLDYTLGWLETHLEEWPKTFEEFIELCSENAKLEEEEQEEEGLPYRYTERINEITQDLRKEGY